VVLEATANAWVLSDQLTPLAGSVTVAHPLAVKLISAARVKTDARDTIKLARLLAANLIPAVWVPPVAVREVRALVTHRKRLVKQRSQARNRLQGVLQRHHLSAPEGSAFARKARAWWLSLPLSRWQSSCASGRILCWKIRSIP
jgi:transposase